MKRRVPFAVLFAISLFVAALLPLYIERTMTEVLFSDGSGGAIQWGWKRCTLRGFYAAYPHMAREQDPAFWLAANVGLAFAYATIISLAASRALRPAREKT